MKKSPILLLTFLLLSVFAKAQFVDIPDSNFRKYLIKTLPACFNAAKQMDTTCSGVLNQPFISCINDSIKDVTGLQYFKNAYSITFYNNQIQSLPAIPKNVTFLGCTYNKLKSLPVLPNTLKDLEVEYNQLTDISTISSSNLQRLRCQNNQLSFIPPLPSTLTEFSCYENNIISLPTLPNGLISLQCSKNKLSTLPNLPNGLIGLGCSKNKLSMLPSLPNGLIYLDCSENKLSTLPSLPPSLRYLSFSNNLLTACPNLPDTLENFDCSYNLFNCLPKLPTTIINLNVLGTGIQCLPNAIIGGGNIYPSGLTICNTACTTSANYSTYVNIPDSIFRNRILRFHPACFNKAEQMDTTCSEIVNDTTFQYNNGVDSTNQIKDLTGIQYFKSLKHLYVTSNLLTTIPNFSDSLVDIQIGFNKLTSLPKLPLFLNYLSCNRNSLTTLPTLPATLFYLDCGNNQFSSLPTLPNSLHYLTCDGNKLTGLPNLPDSLTYLSCQINQQLRTLPPLPNSLYYLYIDRTNITSLQQNLPKKLIGLITSYTPISYLPPLDSLDQLQYLYCEGDTNLFCLPKLPNSLTTLALKGSGIQCVPSIKDTGIYYYGPKLPVCNPTNNSHQCRAFPTVLGKVFGDENSNGIKDTGEFYLPYIPLTLNTGESVFSNNVGQFAISTKDTGSFTLTTIAPPFFKAVPAKASFNFADYSTSLTLSDIALQPLVLKDSLSINIYPWQSAIPGDRLVYSVEYRNLGTISSKATIRFTYDTSKLIFDSASVPLVSSTGNTLVWRDTIAAYYFGNNYYHNNYHYPVFYFKVKTKALVGTSLPASASIASAQTNASTTNNIIIRGSYDPNNKEATPQLTTTQVANGETIDYRIHFQNVGTAPARNIVIADTLSQLLNPSLLQMVSCSHNPNVTIANGIIYFEFININLIDSGSNQPLSNGFIHFKLKPKTTVLLGSNIDNKASIYFDYNSPVVTNIASTFIKNVTLPVSISQYAVVTSQEEAQNTLNILNKWTTENETNTAYFNVQKSLNAIDFFTIGKVEAKGASSYQFLDIHAAENAQNNVIYYRLEIMDKNGSRSYSETKSIAIPAKDRAISIYPNPAKDFIVVNGKNIAEITMLDNLGSIVYSKKVANTFTFQNKLALSAKPGVYWVRITLTDGKIITEKLVKE